MDSYANQSTGAEKSQVTVGAGYNYKHCDMQQYAARPTTKAFGNGHYTSEQYGAQASIKGPNNGYHTGQQYAAQVAAGIVSLGVDASPALQLSLADQHGSLRSREPVYSIIGEVAEFPGGYKNRDLEIWDESLQYEPCVELGYESGGLGGNVGGIGSQFDSRVEYCNYL